MSKPSSPPGVLPKSPPEAGSQQEWKVVTMGFFRGDEGTSWTFKGCPAPYQDEPSLEIRSIWRLFVKGSWRLPFFLTETFFDEGGWYWEGALRFLWYYETETTGAFSIKLKPEHTPKHHDVTATDTKQQKQPTNKQTNKQANKQSSNQTSLSKTRKQNAKTL